jgi:hypothetical protein
VGTPAQSGQDQTRVTLSPIWNVSPPAGLTKVTVPVGPRGAVEGWVAQPAINAGRADTTRARSEARMFPYLSVEVTLPRERGSPSAGKR